MHVHVKAHKVIFQDPKHQVYDYAIRSQSFLEACIQVFHKTFLVVLNQQHTIQNHIFLTLDYHRLTYSQAWYLDESIHFDAKSRLQHKLKWRSKKLRLLSNTFSFLSFRITILKKHTPKWDTNFSHLQNDEAITRYFHALVFSGFQLLSLSSNSCCLMNSSSGFWEHKIPLFS